MTYLMSDAAYAPWAADSLSLIEQEGVQKIAILGITPSGEVLTAYCKCQIKPPLQHMFRLMLCWIP